MDTQNTIITGIVGMLAGLGAFGFSLLDNVEQWMRIASLSLGIVAAVMSIRKLSRDINDNDRR
jgi:hypothetical protein